jgi:hypothetical protein
MRSGMRVCSCKAVIEPDVLAVLRGAGNFVPGDARGSRTNGGFAR